jgi:hypothetical protein
MKRQTVVPARKGIDFTLWKSDTAKFITDAVNDYVDVAPTNWSKPFNHPFFTTPAVIAFGDGDAEDYLNIKKVWPWTLTPRECLEKQPGLTVGPVDGAPQQRSMIQMPGGHSPTHAVITRDGKTTYPNGEPPLPPWPPAPTSGQGPAGLPSRGGHSPGVTCISIGLPIHPETLKAETSYPIGNSPEFKAMSLWGAHTGFIGDLSYYLVNLLQSLGVAAIAPTFTDWGHEMMMDFQYEGPTSRYSISPAAERAWAVAAGLGTYGLHDMVISRKGTAIIITTIMTSARVPPTPKPTIEYCLWYRNGSCGKCVGRCPGQAIYTKLPPNPAFPEGAPFPNGPVPTDGRLAAKCDAGSFAASEYNQTYLRDRMLKETGDYAATYCSIIFGSTVGLPFLSFPACGRCYTDVPCATGIPE